MLEILRRILRQSMTPTLLIIFIASVVALFFTWRAFHYQHKKYPTKDEITNHLYSIQPISVLNYYHEAGDPKNIFSWKDPKDLNTLKLRDGIGLLPEYERAVSIQLARFKAHYPNEMKCKDCVYTVDDDDGGKSLRIKEPKEFIQASLPKPKKYFRSVPYGKIFAKPWSPTPTLQIENLFLVLLPGTPPKDITLSLDLAKQTKGVMYGSSFTIRDNQNDTLFSLQKEVQDDGSVYIFLEPPDKKVAMLRLNGESVEMRQPLSQDCRLEVATAGEYPHVIIYRHEGRLTTAETFNVNNSHRRYYPLGTYLPIMGHCDLAGIEGRATGIDGMYQEFLADGNNQVTLTIDPYLQIALNDIFVSAIQDYLHEKYGNKKERYFNTREGRKKVRLRNASFCLLDTHDGSIRAMGTYVQPPDPNQGLDVLDEYFRWHRDHAYGYRPFIRHVVGSTIKPLTAAVMATYIGWPLDSITLHFPSLDFDDPIFGFDQRGVDNGGASGNIVTFSNFLIQSCNRYQSSLGYLALVEPTGFNQELLHLLNTKKVTDIDGLKLFNSHWAIDDKQLRNFKDNPAARAWNSLFDLDIRSRKQDKPIDRYDYSIYWDCENNWMLPQEVIDQHDLEVSLKACLINYTPEKMYLRFDDTTLMEDYQNFLKGNRHVPWSDVLLAQCYGRLLTEYPLKAHIIESYSFKKQSPVQSYPPSQGLTFSQPLSSEDHRDWQSIRAALIGVIEDPNGTGHLFKNGLKYWDSFFEWSRNNNLNRRFFAKTGTMRQAIKRNGKPDKKIGNCKLFVVGYGDADPLEDYVIDRNQPGFVLVIFVEDVEDKDLIPGRLAPALCRFIVPYVESLNQ